MSQPEFVELNTEHKTALIFMREVGAIDNITYRQLNGCSARQASADLKKLQALDLISPKGNNRSTYYVPAQRLLELKHTTFDANSVCLDANGVCSDANMVCQDANMVCPDANMVCQDANMVCLEDILKVMPEDLKREIESLGKRSKPAVLEDLLIRMCTALPLNMPQLAAILNRNERYLRNFVIPKLMREKRLFFTIPEMVKHPNQKYTARKG